MIYFALNLFLMTLGITYVAALILTLVIALQWTVLPACRLLKTFLNSTTQHFSAGVKDDNHRYIYRRSRPRHSHVDPSQRRNSNDLGGLQ